MIGHGDGPESSIHEEIVRTCVERPRPAPYSFPHLDIKYALHSDSLSRKSVIHDVAHIRLARSSGESMAQRVKASSPSVRPLDLELDEDIAGLELEALMAGFMLEKS